MRHIDKTSECLIFENYKQQHGNTLQFWHDVRNSEVKLSLHQHLWQEQKGLCVYCQQEIPQKVRVDSQGNIHPSHIEHIRPKSEFPHLTFEHQNLSVSCEGFNIQNLPNPITKNFCGHTKANDYDNSLFLNPIEEAEIEDYFFYDIQGKIESSGENNDKADYMISLLNLNHTILKDMRSEMYSLILEQVTSQNLDIEEYLAVNNTQLPAFYAMLKQLFWV